jgi:hypothetical protein
MSTQVGLVAPYLAYMRQDKRFQPGEGVTSRSFRAAALGQGGLARDGRPAFASLCVAHRDLFHLHGGGARGAGDLGLDPGQCRRPPC